MEEEIWRPINGYEGLYEVSDQGRVRNARTGFILKGIKNKKGYLSVHFFTPVDKIFRVNRLVAFAFPEICGEYFEGAVCNHKNEKVWDNRAVNLEWITNGDNIRFGSCIERRAKTNTNNPKHSKPVRQLNLDYSLKAEFPSIGEAERQTGIHSGSICRSCKTGGLAGGSYWEYT